MELAPSQKTGETGAGKLDFQQACKIELICGVPHSHHRGTHDCRICRRAGIERASARYWLQSISSSFPVYTTAGFRGFTRGECGEVLFWENNCGRNKTALIVNMFWVRMHRLSAQPCHAHETSRHTTCRGAHRVWTQVKSPLPSVLAEHAILCTILCKQQPLLAVNVCLVLPTLDAWTSKYLRRQEAPRTPGTPPDCPLGSPHDSVR